MQSRDSFANRAVAFSVAWLAGGCGAAAPRPPASSATSDVAAPASHGAPNELVGFLAGEWDDVGVDVETGKPIRHDGYPETMVVKDADTLTITAHGFRDGKDLTKDMRLVVRGQDITLEQGGTSISGHKDGNTYVLVGRDPDGEYRLRLYTLGDKYVFIRELWKNGTAQEVDMSYLTRRAPSVTAVK